MSSQKPTYQDADLLLRVYELRRETLMRTSRDAINGFWPKSYDDVKAYTAPGHPVNAAWRLAIRAGFARSDAGIAAPAKSLSTLLESARTSPSPSLRCKL